MQVPTPEYGRLERQSRAEEEHNVPAVMPLIMSFLSAAGWNDSNNAFALLYMAEPGESSLN